MSENLEGVASPLPKPKTATSCHQAYSENTTNIVNNAIWFSLLLYRGFELTMDIQHVS
jgi:hypothetical protein